MNASTCPIIKVHKYKVWWQAYVDENLQCDRMELLCHLESPSSLGSSHWGHINVVVKDIFKLKINTLVNQLNRRGGEQKPQGKHDTCSWILHKKGDTTYKSLQEKGGIHVNLFFF
jgi:hypothetical protein